MNNVAHIIKSARNRNVDLDRLFWNILASGDQDDCWEWRGARSDRGYGLWSVTTDSGVHKRLRAHRVSYYLWHGEDPGKMYVCHSCDNPPCCNPAHLHLGTHSTNIQEAWDRGRFPRTWTGSKKVRGTERERFIRCCETMTRAELAREFGLNRNTVTRYLGEWDCSPKPTPLGGRPNPNAGRPRKFTDADRPRVLTAVAADGLVDAARDLGAHPATVKRYIREWEAQDARV